jgi:ABC-type multidrug transport system fused ATPase/permease subunit
MKIPAILDGGRMRLMVFLVANGIGQAAAAVGTALLVRSAFDRLIVPSRPAADDAILWVGLGLLGVALLGAWLRMRERVDAERLGQDYVYDVRLTLFDRLSEMPARDLQRRSRGGTLLRFVGDLTALRQWASLGVARLTVAGVAAFGSLVALGLVDITLAAVVGVALGSGAGLAFVMGRKMEPVVREARKRRAHLAANIAEKIGTMAVVQVFGQYRRERRRVRRQGRRLFRAMVARARIAGRLRAVTEGTTSIATGAALLTGAIQVAAGQATTGTVVAAMTIVGLLVPPLRDLGRIHEYWHGARVSRAKINGFLDAGQGMEQRPDAVALRPGLGWLAFEGVGVDGALTNVTAMVKPGSKVAIVGPNGSGKSTLLALVARLARPDQGAVLIDAQDLADTSVSSIRRVVAMVSPDLPLLRGSIRKNLLYRWPSAPQEEIDRVCALCDLDELLQELPAGLETRLTEGGMNLSLGQRQRLSLARALVGDPRVLLLDEADANLDPKAAGVLNRVLSQFDGTVLMVTHRPDRLAAADLIWHLEDGRLVETGCPRSLLNGAGPTSQLFGRGLALAS